MNTHAIESATAGQTLVAAPTIRYYAPDGALFEIVGRIGDSVMETGVKNGVPGILAECGGACSCATCHVYVDDASFELAGAPDDLEDDMLDGAASERLSNSRLSCQLRIQADFNGFTVRIAPEQI
ncbi:MAG: (2Fe-2S)-binding protein [Cryobacterium sp.]|nr:(2Fe-2S)-binding protein [Cryobacterium sp.]